MVRRKKLGLLFSYEESWIGGTYYILNIVHALNTLDETRKPEVTILSSKEEDFDYVQSETGYPFLGFLKIKRKRRIDSLIKIYKKIKYLYKAQVIDPDLDMIFPNPEEHYIIENDEAKCYWIPDFQEENLPELFPIRDIVNRKQDQIKVALTAKKLILSSYDALNTYQSLYPFARNTPLVLQFAVSNKVFSLLDYDLLQKKYRLKEGFFFCANQFWIHKNHMLLLEAVKKLKAGGLDVQVLFSGKDHDYRGTGLLDKLKQYVLENDLSEHVSFLGFIDRNEMLNLMHYSAAVIQPSLSEGWSTVVEDAKSLGKFVIASDLELHKEQLQNNFTLFKARESDSLVAAIKNFVEEPPELVDTDYQENIRVFGEKFYEYI